LRSSKPRAETRTAKLFLFSALRLLAFDGRTKGSNGKLQKSEAQKTKQAQTP
jgi:hypothetical protein